MQIEKLVEESAAAISFIGALGLPLKDVIQLGGHSAPRTHRLEGIPIGAAMMKTMASAAAEKHNIHLITGASVTRLCYEDSSPGGAGGGERRVTAVVFKHQGGEGETELPAGAVVLATGGAACDVEPDGLMQEYAPDLVGKATSSGAQATGMGIKLARAVRDCAIFCICT